MTEEEKKAIEFLDNYIKDDKEDIKILNRTIDEDIDYYNEVAPIKRRLKYLEIIKSIIEKLQKENLLLSAKENMSDYFEFKRNYILKDKIREIINEELPDDEICKVCEKYDVNGVVIKQKLIKVLEED